MVFISDVEMKNALVFNFYGNNEIIIKPCCWNQSLKTFSLKEFFKIKDFNYFLNMKFNNPKPLPKKLCTIKCDSCLGPVGHIQIRFLAECNLNCYHCFSTRHEKSILREKLMWYTLNNLRGFNLNILSLSGGEIMTSYDKLIEYLSSINSNDFKNIRFYTNGLLLDDNRIQTLKRISEKTGINYYFFISIDAITKETYEKVRIGGDFNKVINNLESVISAFSKNNVIVLNTIKKPNRHEAELFEDFYKEKFKLDDDHIYLSYDLLDIGGEDYILYKKIMDKSLRKLLTN